MSIEAMSWALTVPIGGNPKVILLGIANHAHPNGAEAYPGLDRLAKYAYCDRSTARRNVRKLIAAGWVIEDGTGPKGQAKYRLPLRGSQNATGGILASGGVASEPEGGGIAMPPEPSLTVLVKTSSSEIGISDPKTSSEDRTLCRLLAEQIRQRNPKARVKSSERWLQDMRRLRERDQNSSADIERLIRWLFTDKGRDASFWADVVQSPSALREHFPKVWAKMIAPSGLRAVQPIESSTSYLERKGLA